MIEEKIENQPQSNEENKPKVDQSLIEIDETIEQPIESSKPLSAHAKKNRLKEMKAQKEAEYKAKQKEEKIRLKELKKQERAQNGGGSKINKKLIIIISIFILLNGVFAFLYFKKPEFLKKLIPGKHKETVELVNSDSTVASETENTADTNSIAAEEQNAASTEMNETAEEETPMPETQSAVSKKSAKEESNSQPLVGKTTKLNGPCWIVSFASVQDEKTASKTVKKMVDKGFIGGYYWMPDIIPGAKQLFKVYSGPYSSEAEARAKQKEIYSINPDAYVMKLNQ